MLFYVLNYMPNDPMSFSEYSISVIEFLYFLYLGNACICFVWHMVHQQVAIQSFSLILWQRMKYSNLLTLNFL